MLCTRVSRCLAGAALVAAAFVSGSRDGQAVMVATTTGNTTAPADDFGFANVVRRGGMTAIYLGDRWVLTAAHIGVGAITLNDGTGATYQMEAGSAHQLHNPAGSGATDLTDLVLYRVVADPGLPSLTISASPLGFNAKVFLVGQGYDRQETQVTWDVGGTYPSGDEWAWTELSLLGDVDLSGRVDQGDTSRIAKNWLQSGRTRADGDVNGDTVVDELDLAIVAANWGNEGDESGFKPLSTKTIRWGTNQIDSSSYEKVTLGAVDILAKRTTFDEEYGTEYECQAVTGDSGGGMFYKRDGQWELAGILNAVAIFPDQPNGASGAVFGNRTYISDLSQYRAEIVSIMAAAGGDATLAAIPEPAVLTLLSGAAIAVLLARWVRRHG
ncbi:MAG: hypothetical protein JW809_15230 [Pirellulales bacterium]|nr:hypothetical protein [Pirellulales bacterium]